MKKLNVHEICAAYNTARKQNVNSEFTNEQITRELMSYGLSLSVVHKLIRNNSFILSYQIQGCGKGKHIRYRFKNEPVHISLFDKLFYGKKEKADLPFEQECVNYLKSLGYKIYKPEGFDLHAFKSENPEIFEKYQTMKEL